MSDRGRNASGGKWAFSPIPERANSFAYRDMEQHKRIVSEAYAGVGWRVPQLLEQFRATDDLYFDAVSLVDLPAWSKPKLRPIW